MGRSASRISFGEALFKLSNSEHSRSNPAQTCSVNRGTEPTAPNAIDHALAHDPQGKGEEFYDDRLLVATPLAVTFTVMENDRLVQVLQVWRQ